MCQESKNVINVFVAGRQLGLSSSDVAVWPVTKLVLVGGGGHAHACLDVIRAEGRFDVIGILDRHELRGTRCLDVPVIGTDDEIPSLIREEMNFLVAVGQIKSPEPRRSLFRKLQEMGAKLPAIVSPTAQVSPYAVIGAGTILMHSVIVGPCAVIGANCILNTGAIVEHDVQIADHSHVSTGALINGGCQLSQGVFVGSGAVLRNGVHVGANAIVGMGANVRSDVLADEIFR